MSVPIPYGQDEYGVRFDWGPMGARVTRPQVAVVVDVLSFSTSVVVAVERGMRVYPYPWKDSSAQEFAEAHDATLAAGRLAGQDAGAPSLSPASLLTCAGVERLVLPSPNGSAIAAAMVAGGATIAAGCLRNAQAIARWLAPAVGSGRTVAVIAAGERWAEDDSLRPALEDHLGSGAILAELAALGFDAEFSPEASMAAEAYRRGAGSLGERMQQCVSGRELALRGFACDVEVAADLNASEVVPVLVDGAFEGSGEGR